MNSSPDFELNKGKQVPDFSLIDTTGKTVRLSEFWNDKPLVLMFLRHYGCAFCKEQAIALRSEFFRFKEAGARILCIGTGSYQTARAFQILYSLPFEIVTCGEDLSIFKTFGLTVARLSQILTWQVLIGLLRNTFRGTFNNPLPLRKARYLMPASFVISPSGIIEYIQYSKDMAELSDIDALLKAVKESRNAKDAPDQKAKRAI